MNDASPLPVAPRPVAPLPASTPRRLRALVDEVLLYRRTSPVEEARIAGEALRHTVRVVRPLLVAACVIGLLWWPFDFVLYADRPEIIATFAVWRAAVVLYCLVYTFTCDRWPLLRRHFAAWGTLLGASITLVIAASLGSLGSMAEPWFASLYFVPMMAIPFLVTLPVRLAATTTIALVALVGFFGAQPAGVVNQGVSTAVGLMAFGVGVSVCSGHAVYHLFRTGLLQSDQLAERTRELEVLSSGLASQVEARTAELAALATHVEGLRESARDAFARDLHDELGQLLAGIRMGLDAAERVRARGGDLQVEHQRLFELLDATLLSTRSLMAHLRPRILDDFGLVAALEWLAADTRERSGLDVRFRASPEDFEVPGDAATAVFRIVQESLSNAIKHAQARTLSIDITCDARRLEATVTDDGVGLPPPAARRAHSLGLLGMRERAAALGGNLELSSRPGGGTRVTVRLPEPHPAAALSEAT